MFSAGCQKSDEPTPDTLLGKNWYNTTQAGDDGHTIFSTTNPNLAWTYDGFRLDADGSFVEYGLDAAFNPETRPGSWKQEGSLKYRISFQNPARKGYLLRIAKPAANQLQARRDY